MAHYVLKDLLGKIIEEYDYPDPIPFVDKEFDDAVADLKTYIDGLPAAQKTGLTKLFRVLKRIAQGAGLQE
jgi:hypothetical protein